MAGKILADVARGGRNQCEPARGPGGGSLEPKTSLIAIKLRWKFQEFITLNPLRSYRSKLQAAFLALALVAIAATYWPASIEAEAALRETTYDRLTAIRETKRRSVEDYFADLTNRVLALSTDESSIAALEQFRAAWPLLPEIQADDPRAARLSGYYRDEVAPRVRTRVAAADVQSRWVPRDPRTRGLQDLFISNSPHPVGTKDLLLASEAGTAYDAVHARYHPTFHRYQTSFGLYDIFLIDARDGRILYTVFKEIDLGARLDSDPYRTTTLARLFERTLRLEPGDATVIEDYAPYVASYFSPAAFIGAPIRRGGSIIGVLAVQVPIERVNRVMTGDRAWTREGMGRTGHTYIVGSDGTLRSDLRLEIEAPERFFSDLQQAGFAAGVVEQVRRDGTAILNLALPPAQARRIFSTPAGTQIGTDVRGTEVIRSHAALGLAGLSWVLVAEMETAEAFAPVAALRRRFFASGLVIAAIFGAVAWGLGRSVTKPVTALVRGTQRLSARDFEVRLPIESADEIGALAASFNAMAERLQATTVSRDDLDAANRELSANQRELQRLNARLMGAQEEERRRLARELHDDLTQRIAAVAIAAGALKQLPDADPHVWRNGLRQIQEDLARISNDVHGLSRRLHSATLEDLGLVAALEGECRGFFERGGPPVGFTHAGPVERIPPDAQLAIYRVVQESLRNIYRHAAADDVTIDLQVEDEHVRLRVEDDGKGFDRNEPGWKPGLGLASMAERARLVDGTLTVDSQPGKGSRLTMRLPIEGPSDGPAAHTAR